MKIKELGIFPFTQIYASRETGNESEREHRQREKRTFQYLQVLLGKKKNEVEKNGRATDVPSNNRNMIFMLVQQTFTHLFLQNFIWGVVFIFLTW